MSAASCVARLTPRSTRPAASRVVRGPDFDRRDAEDAFERRLSAMHFADVAGGELVGAAG